MRTPQAICVPPGKSNTFLLAETLYLMQGHKYLSDLYKPQLHFNDDTVYTMSVQWAHKILKLLPISATRTNPHRSILLHPPAPYETQPTQNFDSVYLSPTFRLR